LTVEVTGNYGTKEKNGGEKVFNNKDINYRDKNNRRDSN
jgi:hypothetical protein